MIKIAEPKLKECMPYATGYNISRYLSPLNLSMEKYSIDTEKRQASFLAQVAHESGSLKYVREIASGVSYEGRKDLGNINVGDGVRFAGRGLIQITGRTNYEALSYALNFDFVEEPEKLELPGAAALSAGWFWYTKKLNELADKNDFERITRRINGGLNGYADRLKHWTRCKKALGI